MYLTSSVQSMTPAFTLCASMYQTLSTLRLSQRRPLPTRPLAVDAGIPSGTSSDFFQRDQLFRDAAVCPDQWLVAPDGYTILAACGPHEIARELQLAQGERRGALSYFLLDALDDLRKRCTEITHESLYEHLRVRFRASWPQQTPMRYGNKDMSFFGHLGARSDMAFFRIYYRAEHQRLCLDAGLAHGLHPNDEYAV